MVGPGPLDGEDTPLRVLGDSADGTGEPMRRWLTPAIPRHHRQPYRDAPRAGRITTDDFVIDCGRRTVTAARPTTRCPPPSARGWLQKTLPLMLIGVYAALLPSADGNYTSLEHEPLLRAACSQRDPEGQARKYRRHRPMVERFDRCSG